MRLSKPSLTGPLYNENAIVTRVHPRGSSRVRNDQRNNRDLWEEEGQSLQVDNRALSFLKAPLPQEWASMLGGPAAATAVQQQHVHRLGNLTITGYNSTLSNRSFASKKNRRTARENHVGFKNGPALNADVVEAAQWTEDEINARTEKLAMVGSKLFPLR